MAISVTQALGWTQVVNGATRSFDTGAPPEGAKGLAILFMRNATNNPIGSASWGNKVATLHSYPASSGASVRIGLFYVTDLANAADTILRVYTQWSECWVAAAWIIADQPVWVEVARGSDNVATYAVTPSKSGLALTLIGAASGASFAGGETAVMGPSTVMSKSVALGARAVVGGEEVTLGGGAVATAVVLHEQISHITFPVALPTTYLTTSQSLAQDIGAPPAGAQMLVGFGAVSGNQYNLPGTPSYGNVAPQVSQLSPSLAERLYVYCWDDLSAAADTVLRQVGNQYSRNTIGYSWVVAASTLTRRGIATATGTSVTVAFGESGDRGRAYIAQCGGWGIHYASPIDNFISPVNMPSVSREVAGSEGDVALSGLSVAALGAISFTAAIAASRNRNQSIVVV